MPDDLSNYLSSGKGRVALSPERMEMMGKEAAQLLIDKGMPLEKSIVKLASDVPDINDEQVKRIIEFANTAAYLSYHEKNKTASANASYPQFALADPQRVLAELHGSKSKESQIDPSYSQSPERRPLSTPKREAALEELFLGANKERIKTAGLPFSYESGASALLDAKENLVALKEHLEHAGEEFDLLRKEAEAEYYDTVKRHLLDGGSFADVMRAAIEVQDDKEKVGHVLLPVIQKLMMERVATADELRGQNEQFSKVAHRVVDEEHPLVKNFGAVLSFTEEVEKAATALENVDSCLADVKKAIKEEFFARG